MKRKKNDLKMKMKMSVLVGVNAMPRGMHACYVNG